MGHDIDPKIIESSSNYKRGKDMISSPKKTKTSSVKKMECIRVVARFRPQNKSERRKNGSKVAAKFYTNNSKSVKLSTQGSTNNNNHHREEEKHDEKQQTNVAHSFAFDNIFQPNATQEQVHENVGKPAVEAVLNGYNATVLAYGQTGSGKTYTMEGPDVNDDIKKGVVPRMVDDLFFRIQQANEELKYTLKVSFLEIYNEQVKDLLGKSQANLSIRENSEKGIWVDGASVIKVEKPEILMSKLKAGHRNRSTASTRMNEDSSRSHSLCIISVEQVDLKRLTCKTGKLYLVDLAGSEKVRKSKASGKQLTEAKNINRSLSALGNVINALTTENSQHVPYRDSKLTRLLQDSFGGNSKTVLVVCCSPALCNFHETISSLRFGQRAKLIKNKVKVNQQASSKELELLLKNAQKEIQSLKAKLNSDEEKKSTKDPTILMLRDSLESKIRGMHRESMENAALISKYVSALEQADASIIVLKDELETMYNERRKTANENAQMLERYVVALAEADEESKKQAEVNKKYETRIIQLQQQIDQNSNSTLLKLGNDSLQKRVAQLEQKLVKLSNVERENTSLNDESVALKKQIDDLKQGSLQKRRDQLVEIQRLQNDKENLEKRTEELETSLAKAQEGNSVKLAELQDVNKSLQSQLEQVIQKSLQQRKDHLSEKHELEESTVSLKEEIDDLKNQLLAESNIEEIEIVAELRKENESLREQIRNLEHESSQQRRVQSTENDRLQVANDSLEEKIQALVGEMSSLEQDHSSKTSELRKQIAELEQERLEQQQEKTLSISLMKKENDSLQKHMETVEEDLSQSKQQLVSEREKMEALKKKFKELENSSEILAQELDSLKRRNRELEGQVEFHVESQSNMTQDLLRAEQLLDEEKVVVHKLEQKIVLLKEENEKELSQERQKVSDLKKQHIQKLSEFRREANEQMECMRLEEREARKRLAESLEQQQHVEVSKAVGVESSKVEKEMEKEKEKEIQCLHEHDAEEISRLEGENSRLCAIVEIQEDKLSRREDRIKKLQDEVRSLRLSASAAASSSTTSFSEVSEEEDDDDDDEEEEEKQSQGGTSLQNNSKSKSKDDLQIRVARLLREEPTKQEELVFI